MAVGVEEAWQAARWPDSGPRQQWRQRRKWQPTRGNMNWRDVNGFPSADGTRSEIGACTRLGSHLHYQRLSSCTGECVALFVLH